MLIYIRWARVWYVWVSALFLKSYRDVASRTPFLPRSSEELQLQLDAYILEKAFYELSYELNNRPEWIRILLTRILHLLGKPV